MIVGGIILAGLYLMWRRRRKARIAGRGLAREMSRHERRDPNGPFWIAYPPGRWRRGGGRR